MTRATLDKAPVDVAAMFDRVAERYDVANYALSLGRERRWRGEVARALAVRPGERVLDVAAGTGTAARVFADAGAVVTACDFSLGMLRVGRRRPHPRVAFVAGDALRLPFRDATFDAVTISFGLRNVADPARALAELRRVTRGGGRLVVCEFSTPTWAPLRAVYARYLARALPALARRIASNPAAYVYLAESIAAWPDQRGLATVLQDAGWVTVQWRNLSGGIVALHRARCPG